MTLDTFVALSSILTGYPESTLKPGADTQKLSELYFNVLNKEVPSEVVSQLNTIFLGLSNPDETTVKTQIVNDPTLGPIAKNIIKMWYLGIWYDLNGNADASYVVSSIAYKNGMVWSTMYAHPMGYSEENFGYWNTAPNTNLTTN
jgi:hypothetical protein